MNLNTPLEGYVKFKTLQMNPESFCRRIAILATRL